MIALEKLAELRGYLSARVPADIFDYAAGLLDEATELFEAELAEAMDEAYDDGFGDGEDHALDTLIEEEESWQKWLCDEDDDNESCCDECGTEADKADDEGAAGCCNG